MLNQASRFFARFTLLVLVAVVPACAEDATEGAPDASPIYEECLDLCSSVDEDVLSLPANMCPGRNPDEDTAYNRCVGECVARMPDGWWCPAP